MTYYSNADSNKKWQPFNPNDFILTLKGNFIPKAISLTKQNQRKITRRWRWGYILKKIETRRLNQVIMNLNFLWFLYNFCYIIYNFAHATWPSMCTCIYKEWPCSEAHDEAPLFHSVNWNVTKRWVKGKVLPLNTLPGKLVDMQLTDW